MGPERRVWEVPHQKSGRHNNLSPQGFLLCCLLDYLSSLTWKKDRCRSFSQTKWEIIHIACTTNPNTLGWEYVAINHRPGVGGIALLGNEGKGIRQTDVYCFQKDAWGRI